ncbi:hypothetical protein TNCV_1430071 [Trichonephila clavipes]|nr:hypothetical protein TNCV_1430071 [Trichonephila clavipes]
MSPSKANHQDSFAWAVVFSDSKAAIFTVNSNSTPASSNILDCKKLLQCLSDYSKQIVLHWISGHCVGDIPNGVSDDRYSGGYSSVTENNCPLQSQVLRSQVGFCKG